MKTTLKSHIISKATIRHYLYSLIKQNGPHIIESIPSVEGKSRSRKITIKLFNENDIKSFLGNTFSIDLSKNKAKILEEYWSNFEREYAVFSKTMKNKVSSLIDNNYFDKSGQSEAEEYIKKNKNLIIKYTLICIKREYIRFCYRNFDLSENKIDDYLFNLDIDIIERVDLDSPNEGIDLDNSIHSQFGNYYYQLSKNYNIKIIDSFLTDVFIIDSPFVNFDNALLFLYQPFGNLLLVDENYSVDENFTFFEKKDKNKYSIIHNNEINRIEVLNKIMSATVNNENINLRSSIYKLTKL